MEALRPHATTGCRLRFGPVVCFDAVATRALKHREATLTVIAAIKPIVSAAIDFGVDRQLVPTALERALHSDDEHVLDTLAAELADRITGGGGPS